MPTDTKRNNGPEGSVPYTIYCKNSYKTFDERLVDVFGIDGSRKCGRKVSTSRKYFMQLGIVSTAKGSAYIELGNTKALVSVFDPREIPKQSKYCSLGELFCDFKFSPFACTRRKSPQTDAEERSMAAAMAKALKPAVCRHLFPNLQLDIFANVLEDDGSALAVVITAAGLALADACIPMFDIVTATTVGVLGKETYLDPNLAEEKICLEGNKFGNHGIVTITKLNTLDQVAEIRQSGNIKLETLSTVFLKLDEACKEVAPIIQHLLVSKVKTRLREIAVASDNVVDSDSDEQSTNKKKEESIK